MAAGKSLTPFYVALGVAAVAGGAFIVRSMMAPSRPPLTLETVAPLATGPRGVVMGTDSAPVEIMEFADFECPACARYAVLQMPDIKQRLVASGRVRVRFVHFPLQGHTRSPMAHLAAACAGAQGRFWDMHDVLFANQEEWVLHRRPESVIEGYADRLGLDRARYDTCVSERAVWGDVLADKALGDSLGVNATPTLYLNGRPLADVPSYDQLRRLVDSLAPLPAAAPAAPARR